MNQHYQFPSPNYLEGAYVEDIQPLIHIDKAFQHVLMLIVIKKLQVMSMGMFDDFKK